MTREIYTLHSEPALDLYERTLDVGAEFCPLASVVVNWRKRLSGRAVSFLADLKPFIEHTVEASTWPGTQILSGTAEVIYFSYNVESVTLLKRYSSRLYDWFEPELPEDLSLLRSHDDPWLASIVHERDAYFVLNSDERSVLLDRIPELLAMLSKDEMKT